MLNKGIVLGDGFLVKYWIYWKNNIFILNIEYIMGFNKFKFCFQINIIINQAIQCPARITCGIGQ
jgi:hypothetical protein